MPKVWRLGVLAAGVLSGSLSPLLGAGPTVYYREDFRNYRDVPPIASAASGAEIGNDPIWSQRGEAIFRPNASGLLFKQFVPVQTSDQVRNYDVLFDFRLIGETSRFDLRLRNGSDELSLAFAPTGVKLSGNGASAEGSFEAPIPANQWRQAAVTVKDGSLQVFVSDDKRVIKPVLQAKLPAQPLGGINFHGYEGSAFAITGIVVRDPAALPDNGIQRLLPAPVQDTAGYKSGAEQPTVTVQANDLFGATFRTGLESSGVKMTVNFADGKSSDVTFSAAGVKGRFNDNDAAKNKDKNTELPDAVIQVKGLSGEKGQINYHVRPLLRRYHTSYSYTDVFHDIIRDWEKLPKASEYPVKVELRKTEQGADVYLNGRFAGALTGAVKNLTFSLASSASLKDPVSVASPEMKSSQYLPLDVAALRRAKSFVGAEASVKPGMTTVNDIPMRVADGNGSADVGLTREGQGNWALEVDEYLARSAFDGLLTEVHFSVPAAPYHKAWVLAAVDPDPAKDPILTTRLAHYIQNGVGNNTLADTTLTLPRGNETPGKGITKVGTVSKKGADGKAVEVPLYLVEIPLPIGSIIDIINSKPHLNFEFFGKPGINLEQIDNSSKPDPNSTSAVQIFGVTLEKSPVTLEMVQAQPGNIFHNDEKRQTTAVVQSLAAAKGKLAWQVLDVDGKKVDEGSADFSFAQGFPSSLWSRRAGRNVPC